LLTLFIFPAGINAQYVFTDNDVTVENGIITHCSYNFSEKSIIIPEILDGQNVIGIANGHYDHNGVFYNKGIQSIQLPKSMETIGRHAFSTNQLINLDLSTCKQLKSIEYGAFIQNKIETINFQNCSNLKSIKSLSFYHNQLKEVNLNQCHNIEYIGEKAFSQNNLSKVLINNCGELNHIGKEAFSPRNLSGFTLPTIKRDNHIWVNTKGFPLREGTLINSYHEENETYTVQPIYKLLDDDVVVENGVIKSCSYNSNNKNILIPHFLDGQEVTGISHTAFANIKILYLSLPEKLTTIADKAFKDNSISILDLSRCKELKAIGEYAFYRNSISKLDLSNNIFINTIGKKAFYQNNIQELCFNGCSSLTTISEEAFSNNYITHIDFHNCSSLKTIYDYAFYNNQLSELDLSSCNSLSTISHSAFRFNKIALLDLSNCVALTHIKKFAFQSNLIKDIDFSNCSSLKEIGEFSFEKNKINSINFMNCKTLGKIGFSAFYNNLISEVNIDDCDNLHLIGEMAFQNNNIKRFNLPQVVTKGFICWMDEDGKKYEKGDFITDFYKQYSAQFPYILTDKDVIVNKGIIVDCSYNFTNLNIKIPDTLDGQTIKGIKGKVGVFKYRKIRYLSLPSSIEFIGSEAFADNFISTLDLSKCTNLSSINQSAFKNNKLTSLNLSNCNSLSSIATSSFKDNLLVNVEIDKCKELVHIGKEAFSNNLINKIILPCPTNDKFINWIGGDGIAYNCGTEFNKFTFSCDAQIPYVLTDDDVVVENGVIVNCNYIGGTALKIPKNLDGQIIIGIKDNMPNSQVGFENQNIVSLILPNTIETLGDYVFNSNPISSINLNDCKKLRSIGNCTFRGNSLVNLNLTNCSSLVSIGKEAFYNNHIKNEKLKLCTTLNKIGISAFAGHHINEFSLPESTYENFYKWLPSNSCHLGYNAGVVVSAHQDYRAQFSYTLKDKDVEVDQGVIVSCNHIGGDRLIIPPMLDGQSIIGIKDFHPNDGVFYNRKLTSIHLPATILKIGSNAFGNNDIREVKFGKNPSLISIGSKAFSNNRICSLNLSLCSNLTDICNGAFSFNNLYELILKNSKNLKNIESYAFMAAFAFKYNDKVDLSGCSSLIQIGTYAFNTKYITEIDFTDCTSLEYIGHNAFSHSSLTSLDLSPCISLKYICSGAFRNNSIKSINLKNCVNLEEIGEKAFMHNSINEIDISTCNELSHIGAYAFAYNNMYKTRLPSKIGNITIWTRKKDNVEFKGGDEIHNLYSEYNAYHKPKKYTVTFIDYDNSVISTQTIDYGLSAVEPLNPQRPKYSFVGWNKLFNFITEDVTISAVYEKNTPTICGGHNAENISFYPNPTQSNITIIGCHKKTIGILSILGAEILKTKITSQKEVIELSKLKKGVYVLYILNDDNIKISQTKFIKQ